MMRIISGSKRGKKLLSLDGENTRPTLERVKQAFFNAIQFDINSRTVLDLFAGSGQLGLEALSRGAEYCHFNDMSKQACDVISKNISACDFTENSKLTCKTYIECVNIIKGSNRKFSLVFLDPPYSNGLVSDALSLLGTSGVLSDDAIIVCESALTDEIDYEGYVLYKEYKYSQIKITILKMKE